MDSAQVDLINTLSTKDFVRNVRAIYDGYDVEDEDSVQISDLHNAFINQARDNHDLYVQTTLEECENPDDVDVIQISSDFLNAVLKGFTYNRLISQARLYACLIQVEQLCDMSDQHGNKGSEVIKSDIQTCLKDIKTEMLDSFPISAKFAYVSGPTEGIETWDVIRQVNDIMANPIDNIGNIQQCADFVTLEFFNDLINLMRQEIAFDIAATSLFRLDEETSLSISEQGNYLNDLLDDIDFAYDKFTETDLGKSAKKYTPKGLIYN